MRLFIAIDPPDFVKEELRKLQEFLKKEKMIAQMSIAHDFHLTLKFLGECDEEKLTRVREALNLIPFDPYELRLAEIGTFGWRATRVVWIGVNAPKSFTNAVGAIENAMGALGFEKEKNFVPHITLTRIKHSAAPESFLAALKKIAVPPMQFQARNFYLFESRLSADGAIHTKVAEFPLRK